MTKLTIEQTILGACLLEGNAFPQVADVLSEKNFSAESSAGYNNQTLWRTMAAMYPTKPINMQTVVHEISDTGFGYYVGYITSRVSSAANLRYNAFQLIELTLREKLIELLTPYTSQAFDKPKVSRTTTSVLMEIIDSLLESDTDTFEVIYKAQKYLKQIQAEPFITEAVDEFVSNIDKRVFKIKEQATVDALFANLQHIAAHGDVNAQLSLAHLVTVIKGIIITGTISKDKMNLILAI